MVQEQDKMNDECEWVPPGVPSQQVYDHKRKVSRLWWEDGAEGDFVVKGGICWPIAVGVGFNRTMKGAVVLIGLDISTNVVYVFDERWFVCIDHVLSADGGIKHEGLAPWFNICWSKYFAKMFYYNHNRDTHRTYMLQVLRSKMIDPKPQFVEVDWDDEAQAERVYLELGSLGRFVGVEGGHIQTARQESRIRPGESISPVLRALYAGLTGLEKYPYKCRGSSFGSFTLQK